MSKFYGQVEGMAQTIATRRGSQYIKSSVQSYDGSIITELRYDDEGQLMVEVRTCGFSSFQGNMLFYGTFEEFVKKLGKKDEING